MPNIEYLLPNIGRTVPPGEPGSGESTGPGRGGEAVGSAFLGAPDAWPGAQLPCSCPTGPLPAPTTGLGCGGGFRPLGCPGLGRSFVFTGFFPELFVSRGLCPGHVLLFNFSSFSPCTPPPSSSRKALLAPAGNQGPMPPLVLSVQSVSSELQEGGNHALIAHVLLAEVVLGRQGCDLS